MEGARKAARAPAYIAGSLAPHSSRAECIDSIGAPKSTVVAPTSAAVIGPTVEPQGMSFRDTNCCTGTPAWSQAMMNAAAALVGATTVDFGAPMLSMHSARELCGAKDPAMYASALAAFLN